MKYKHHEFSFVNSLSEDKMATDMMLFGMISGSNSEGMFDADSFAKEMVFLGDIGFKEITININSIGGGIIKGYSILNAITVLRKKGVKIHTNVVGVADSMAGMIASFGDKGRRTVANFGSGVVHEPLAMKSDGSMITIDEMEEGDLKTEALNMRSSLVSLMSNSTGQSEEKVKQTMKASKRLNAQEMLSFGMVDKIVTHSNKTIDFNNKTATELMVACSFINKNSNKMVEVNKVLNLTEDASESSVVKAVIALQNKVKEQKEALSGKDTEIVNLKSEKTDLVNQVKTIEDEKATSYVDSLINSGKLNKDNREVLVNQATKDFEAFKTLTDSLDVTFVDVNKKIVTTTTEDNKKEMALEFFNMRKENTLGDLEKSNPTKYGKLEKAYLESNIDFDNQ